MANKQVVYTDRVAGVSVVNGLVRLDLAMFTGQTKGKDGKADGLRGEITHQLVMPLDAFIAGFGVQQKLVKELAARQQKRKAKAEGADEAAKA